MMKKNWINPLLESLEISETAGGPQENDEADGVTWFDEKAQMWTRKRGQQWDDISEGGDLQ